MVQKKSNLTDFLRTLADWLDQRQPPITEIKSISINKITKPGKNFNAKIKVTEAAKKLKMAGEVEISVDHLNVCDWVL